MNKKATLNISISVLFGIFFAAACQRVNNLFFYNVFIGVCASGVISLAQFRFINKSLSVEKPFRLYVLLLSMLLCFSFLSTIPLTIDRSYSVWLIKNVAEANSSHKILSRQDLLAESITFFSPTGGQLDRRISEQIRIGNFTSASSSQIKITRKGWILAHFHHIIGILFDLDPKYSKLSWL